MRKLWCLFFAGVVSLTILEGCGGSHPLAFFFQGQCFSQEVKTRNFAEKVESLIAQLRSPNKNPFEGGVKFPFHYPIKAEKPVEAARQELIGLGKEAFPILIEHITDKGYSCPSEGASCPCYHDVGVVCYYIIVYQVDLIGRCYKSRDGLDGKGHMPPNYFSQFRTGGLEGWQGWQNEMRKWWEGHKHQSLQEMQMETLRWKIAQEQLIGFQNKEDEKIYLQPLISKLKELSLTQGKELSSQASSSVKPRLGQPQSMDGHRNRQPPEIPARKQPSPVSLAAPVPGDNQMPWPEHWSDHVGKTITLEGTAANAKLGALLIGKGNEIWIDGLDRWPEGFYSGGEQGKHLRVTGTVIKKGDLPVFVQKPGEAPKSGIPVNSEEELERAKWRYLLKDSKWTVLE